MLIFYALALCGIACRFMRRYLKIADKKRFAFVCGVQFIVAAILTGVLLLKRQTGPYGYALLGFIQLLTVVAIEDCLTMQIDRILVSVLWAFGAGTAFVVPDTEVWKIILFAVLLTLILYLFSFKSNEGIGKGDVLCMGAAALCFPFAQVFVCMIDALAACLLFGIARMIMKKVDRKQRLPFTPFILIGMAATLCWLS